MRSGSRLVVLIALAYVVTPFIFALDVATSPFQLIAFLATAKGLAG